METIDKVKDLRLDLDALSKLSHDANALDSHGDFIMAKAWLGKVLGGLGNPTPYPKDGSRKTKEDINETADTVTMEESVLRFYPNYKSWNSKNEIEKVDFIRQKANDLSGSIFSLKSQVQGEKNQIALNNAYSCCLEGRMNGGFYLERIRHEDQGREGILI